jgi:hypothetical protein
MTIFTHLRAHLEAHRRPSLRTIGLISAGIALLALAWWLRTVLDQHEGTAAWVQATGALLIIGATAWFGAQNSRETRERELNARRQLWASIAVLARKCLAALDALLKVHRHPSKTDPHGFFLRSYVPSDFEIPLDGLATLPLHQIGDANLITAVLNLRAGMSRIKKDLDDILRDPVRSPALEFAGNERTSIFNAVASILRIVEGTAAEAEISRLAANP